MKRTYKMLVLCLLVIGTLGLFHTQASAVNQVSVTKSKAVLYVKSGKMVQDTVAYKKEKAHTTHALVVRTGPGTEYAKIKTLPKSEEVTRVGQMTNAKWDIVKISGNYYFVSRKYLTATTESNVAAKYTPTYFRRMGVIHWNGWRWTWYSQRVLPGGGLRIPGRHVDAQGYVCDENDYICLASTSLSKGTVVKTPFGKKGKVYDSGCARGTLDVYVNW